ncbi:proteinrelated to Gim complex component GIM4 [Purpureocillium lilacinum]|uniref:Proteinrelated to Gim complex component GIM4 n=1 Tax=Purpureocillium lilacinum TaxID=33203 RepID=A0A179HNF9_PURLI|nr:proteinrelated to Gim complex component GIM4 [Purpureocillium lilacinum]OAQ91966.1 proteinrelated to Gim complex component GIM4 [Purpureocillium lilacinum]
MNARTTAAGAPAASGATINTLATADLGARQIASSSTSVTDMTDIEPSVVCSPATSTASSGASKPQVLRHRHSMHPTLRQLRFHETAARDNGDALGGKHMESLGAWDWDNNNDTTQHIASRSPNVRHRYQHSVRRCDHDTRPDRCPSSPPGEQQSLQTWNRSKKGQSVSNITHTSSEESSYIGTDYAAPSTAMTREQFEALPATVQRKYFSTLERLRFAQDPHPHPRNVPHPPFEPHSAHHRAVSASREGDARRPPLRFGFSTDELDDAPHRRSQLSRQPVRVYDDPTGRLAIQRQQSAEPLAPLRRRKSVILDATDEAYLRIGKRKSQNFKLETLSNQSSELQPADDMFSTRSQAREPADFKKTRESLYDSFRWLEEDDDLDLRLYLDDYHMNLREEVPVPTKNWRPSFRRHLSISKRPFGRASVSLSRPATKDSNMGPLLMGSPIGSTPGSPGHARRRSRALSLMSSNKQSARSDSPPAIDPAASHYQDPDARMKLRVYLASPHKFDEAIEFGFPSIDEVQDKENSVRAGAHSRAEAHRLRTFLEDDASSIYSEASIAEPESPKTPETLDKQLRVRSARVSQDPPAEHKLDYAQAPASSREMTLRMTLTRSDLRAGDEQIYGWQKRHATRRSQTRNEPHSPPPFSSDGNSKESIERQFAAMDQEYLASDNGVVKRFWNRMRRT